MEKTIGFLPHRRWQHALVLYVDGELPQNELVQMRLHLESCSTCRKQLADIHACRKVLKAGKMAPLMPTEQLWQRITRKISASPQGWLECGDIFSLAKLRYLRWAIVAATSILFGLAVWKKSGEGERIILPDAARYSSAAIDYGLFLDDLRQELAAANFYKRYPAQFVELAEAQQAMTFPLAAIEALPDSFRLECVRVLECNGKKCVQFTCRKAGKTIDIFQHALGQPWTLGGYAIARTPICKVPCLMVNTKELVAVSWRGENSEYLAVGEFTPQEFEPVVQILR